MILLDTNVVVAHLKGNGAVTARLRDRIEDVAVPARVVADPGSKVGLRRRVR
jgi:predicted nucleic acid-binding protein